MSETMSRQIQAEGAHSPESRFFVPSAAHVPGVFGSGQFYRPELKKSRAPQSTAEHAAGMAHPTEAQEGHAAGGIPEGGRCASTAACSAEGIHPPASQQVPQGRAGVCRSVYRSPETRSACKALLEASAEEHRRGSHHMHFNDREFLHLYYAVSHARNKLRVAVGRGRAAIGDLRATDSLWEKLESVMWKRQTWRRA